LGKHFGIGTGFEASASLERKREALIKLAKELNKELDMSIVCSLLDS